MAGVMYHTQGATNDPAYGISAKAYSISYLEALYARNGAWRYIRNFTADVSAFGESVAIPTFPALTAVDVLNSTGVFTYENGSLTPQTITINKHKAIAYDVPETVLIQSKIDVQSAFAKAAADAVADSLDHEFAKLIPSLTTNSVSSINVDLTEAICLAAMGKLVANGVPLSNPDDLVWILPASQWAAVHTFKNSYATSYKVLNTNTQTNGINDVRASMDTLFGIPVFWRYDAELEVSAGESYGGLFYKDAVGIAIQKMPTMRAPQPITGTVNTELLCTALFGIATLKQSVACLLNC